MSSPSPGQVRLGFLYPGHAAEDDYPAMAAMLSPVPEIDLVHTSVGEDAHRVDALLDLGGTERLAAGASQLGTVDVVLWACTSGSFVFGLDGARAQVESLAEAARTAASSTSFAFVEAVRSLGLRSVAVAATYPPDVVAAFRRFLDESGVQVVADSAQDIITAAEVGTLSASRIADFVAAGDHPDAEAVLVPDTAMHSAELVAELETALAKPVLTANAVTMWEALRLAGGLGRTRADPRLGRLFATPG